MKTVMGWKTFNDRLALLLMVLIPAIWLLARWMPLPGEVTGATIVVFTLVAQFYFRRSDPGEPRQ